MNSQLESLLIATRNPAKDARYRSIFAKYTGQIMGLGDVAIAGKPEERGETAEQNAEIKARFYARQARITAFAEDEALYVDFLSHDRQPGVHVRRINGVDEVSDEHLLAHWEEIIAQVAAEERTGHWHVAYCIARPDGSVVSFALDYPILFFSPSSSIRIPGWPLSSMEGPIEWAKPHSELTAAERQIADQRVDQAVAKAIQAILRETLSSRSF